MKKIISIAFLAKGLSFYGFCIGIDTGAVKQFYCDLVSKCSVKDEFLLFS